MADRLSREAFFAKTAGMDEAALRKALWTLYWRGTAQMRERIEGAIDPAQADAVKKAATAPPNAELVLRQVTYFAELARSGAYIGRDRRVTPQERTRWRHEFRRLATDALAALRATEPDDAIRAIEIMIGLALAMDGTNYFRSEDPVEAAGFVVSDAAAAAWSVSLRRHGMVRFAEIAAPQLVRWESRYGWTRSGFGRTSQRETSLASVIANMLPSGDSWGVFAQAYLATLDGLTESPEYRYRYMDPAEERAHNLAEWHGMLLDRLLGAEDEHLLDLLAEHPALGGPERDFFAARLAHARDDDATATTLIRRCLKRLPGSAEFREFAITIGAVAN